MLVVWRAREEILGEVFGIGARLALDALSVEGVDWYHGAGGEGARCVRYTVLLVVVFSLAWMEK